MSIATGQKAPDFTLYNDEKNPVTLSEQRGKNVLLLFFPFAFTGTCTKELCSVRDNIAIYNDLNATVYGISVDSVHVLKRYKEDQALNFSLLSDFNREVSKEYDSQYEIFALGTKGVAKRSAFVIDKDGIVRYAEVLENATEIPDFNAIRQCLNNLK